MISTSCKENMLAALKYQSNKNYLTLILCFLFVDINVIKIDFNSSSWLPGHPNKKLTELWLKCTTSETHWNILLLENITLKKDF